jgi:hypothetical protein
VALSLELFPELLLVMMTLSIRQSSLSESLLCSENDVLSNVMKKDLTSVLHEGSKGK